MDVLKYIFTTSCYCKEGCYIYGIYVWVCIIEDNLKKLIGVTYTKKIIYFLIIIIYKLHC